MAIEDIFVDVVGSNPVMQGLVGGFVSAFLNLVGALAVLACLNI